MGRSRALASALLFCSFLVVSVVQSWPLTLSLSSALTGQPGGDTGVYVWNLWVFRHELLQGKSPLRTDTILATGGPADLSLHNYTIASDLLALPLQSFLDVVTTFNLVYLLNVAIAGLGAYVLARRMRQTDPVDRGAAWLGGVLFACSPFLVARSTAHFSLVAAAALPFFVVALDRTWHRGRPTDAALTGAAIAWAAYSDPYYAVYCVLLGLAVLGGHMARIETTIQPPRSKRLAPAIDVGIGAAALFVAVVALTPGESFSIGDISVSIRSLYTPVLLLVFLGLVRVWMTLRPRVVWTSGLPPRWLSNAIVAVVVAANLLAPLIAAITIRAFDGRLVAAPILWRSSAPGVDLLSFFLPNPNHPLAPSAIVDWLASEPGRFEENVVSIPWIAIAVIVAARRLTGRWASRLWLFVMVAAAALAVGPFLRVAGIETYVPTPWAFLRYVPLIGEARMPARFGVIVALGAAVLFAGSLSSLCRRYPHRYRMIMTAVALVLAAELWSAPRRLYTAVIPPIYSTIARDPRPVSVLGLPVGLRDGLSSIGDFSAISQFNQTTHGKPIVGGYLSRISDRRKDNFLEHPFLAALAEKSEGHTLTEEMRQAAMADADEFARSVHLGYVVIDHARTTPALRHLAIAALRLREVERDGLLHLYVPDAAPGPGGSPPR